jgi:hypothetical protein
MASELEITTATRDSITISKPLAPCLKTVHIYTDVDTLEGIDKVGTKHCVQLLQVYASAPPTALWEEGELVWGNINIAKGTAIATFVNGKYESKNTGNHAAFYLSQDENGISMMDQWKSDSSKPKVSSRYLRKKGKNTDGTFTDPSNNAEAYSIILW